MVRNFAFTFGIALLSMATISQTANAQVYQTSGCYCQRPVQVVRNCQTPQPIQYYQPTASYYGQPVVQPAMVTGTAGAVASQRVYSGYINTNSSLGQYPSQYSTPVSTETILPAATVEGSTTLSGNVFPTNGLISNSSNEVIQAGFDDPTQPATIAGTIQPVATGDTTFDASATPPAADDAPTTATPLKVDSSTDAPTPASEKSILSK